MTTDRPARPMLTLDRLALRALATADGLTTDQDTARHLGLSPSTVSRGVHGGAISSRFVAAALYAFPDATFGDLFAVSLSRMQASDV